MIGASIGIAMAPGDGDESEKLLKNADMALSRAKNDPRGTFTLLRSRHGCPRPEPPQDRDRPARRDPERRAAAALSAADRSRDRAHHRLRGAGALAASRARHDLAGRIHSGRRGDRPDQSARRADAAPRLRRCGALARRRPRRGQPVAAAVPGRQSVVAGDGCAEAVRPAGEPAGTGNHRDAAAGKERARCWRRCTRCARSASASRWTISAPAIPA